MSKFLVLSLLLASMPTFAKASCASSSVTAVQMTFGVHAKRSEVRVFPGLPDTYPLLGIGHAAPNVYTVKILGAEPRLFVVAFGSDSSCQIAATTEVCHGTTSFNAVFEPCRTVGNSR